MIRRLLRQSLAARLSAAVLALSLAAIGLVATLSYQRAAAALEDRLLERLDAFADQDATSLDAWVDRQRDAIEVLARSYAPQTIADGEHPRNRAIAPFPPSLFAASEIFVLSYPGGRVLRSSRAEALDSYAVDQEYYQRGQQQTHLQPAYPSGQDGKPTMTIASPIRDPEGRLVAVLAAHLDIAELERAIFTRQSEVPIEAYLVNRNKAFVSAARFGDDAYRRGVDSEGITRALAGVNNTGLYADYRGVPVAGAFRWIPELELALLIESPQAAAFAPARQLLLSSLLVGVLAASLLSFGIVLITRRFTRPVMDVAQAATAVAAGDFTVETAPRGSDEVAELAVAFNSMTSRLRALYGELASQVRATRAALDDAQTNRAVLQDVVNSGSTLVIVTDLDGSVRLVNKRFADLTGGTASEATGRDLGSLLTNPRERALAAMMSAARDADAPVERELELGPSGNRHVWQALAFPLRHDDQSLYGIGLIATDLTERARAESDRRERDASVQQAQKLESLGIMAGGIAHDFNNLLSAILGNVDLALGSLDDPHEIQEALEQIARASRRASELTRQMLAYAGRASLRREVVDARSVFSDLLPLVRAAHSKKVRFELGPLPDPLYVELDPSQLSQVVLNLLTNAAEAIRDNEGSVRLTAGREAPPPGAAEATPIAGWVRFSVDDTGAGIPDKVRARMFDPFFSTKSSGRGLGLSAVRGIVRSLGGVLHVESTTGVGTRFDIYLPASSAELRRSGEHAVVAGPQMRGLALVIDDEEALRRVSRRTLEGMGFEVVEAADGVEGLDRAKELGDDLTFVMLDLTMPRKSGLEVLEELRQSFPELPVLIASGYDRATNANFTDDDPNRRFLQKPFGVSALREAVSQLLA
ncbi:MAG: PAS domain-containing protein [Gemmatimonadaceae bacterium]|nr:PAS domain-containing protein [Gemmatimonadaceae bacterium]